MKEIYRQRLLRLADILDKVPEDRFNIQFFGQRTTCGTVCCACGWAALDPEFNKQGFRAEWSEKGAMGLVYDDPDAEECTVFEDSEAADVFFGLGGDVVYDDDEEEDDFTYLFMYDGYENKNPPPCLVSARIREYVAERTPVLV